MLAFKTHLNATKKFQKSDNSNYKMRMLSISCQLIEGGLPNQFPVLEDTRLTKLVIEQVTPHQRFKKLPYHAKLISRIKKYYILPISLEYRR